jgi:hypothetical protein
MATIKFKKGIKSRMGGMIEHDGTPSLYRREHNGSSDRRLAEPLPVMERAYA